MSGLEKIIDRIKSKGEEKKESILKEARKEAEEKEAKARKEAEAEKKGIISEGKKKADQIKRRELANARKKAREKNLQVRENLIQEVLEEAKEKLVDLRGDNEEYRGILKSLIVSGGEAVGGGKLEVSVLRNDKKILTDSEIENMEREISEETGEETELEVLANLSHADGGAVVQKSDGSISSDNTFDARLDRMKSSLRSEIAEILFED